MTINTANEQSHLHTGLRDAVRTSVAKFLDECGKTPPSDLYDLVLEQVEEPLLHLLMKECDNNQCEVTRRLGLARGTVRKKLKKYGLID